MSASKRTQGGFSPVEILVVVVVVVVVGLLGYVLYGRMHQSSNGSATAQTQTSPATAHDVATAPQIKTADDLTKAEKVLDSSDVSSGTDTSQLDTQTSGF